MVGPKGLNGQVIPHYGERKVVLEAFLQAGLGELDDRTTSVRLVELFRADSDNEDYEVEYVEDQEF